jgi:hypothetical protein
MLWKCCPEERHKSFNQAAEATVQISRIMALNTKNADRKGGSK